MRKFIFLVVLSLVAFQGFSVTTWPATKQYDIPSLSGFHSGVGYMIKSMIKNGDESFYVDMIILNSEKRIINSIDVFLSRPEATKKEEAAGYTMIIQGIFYFLEKDPKAWAIIKPLIDQKLLAYPGKPTFPILE